MQVETATKCHADFSTPKPRYELVGTSAGADPRVSVVDKIRPRRLLQRLGPGAPREDSTSTESLLDIQKDYTRERR